jgi:1,6-anhydro-N-acetylmuramate kinase
VRAVCRIIRHLPRVPKAWIVAGDRARNRTLMKILKLRPSPVTVETANDAGWSADLLVITKLCTYSSGPHAQ